MKKRASFIRRQTGETDISIRIGLDKPSWSKINTGVPFLDHMLTLFAKHSNISLSIAGSGDTIIDDHHTVEDTAITLGLAIDKALGDKKGISRYGNFLLPMDESLAYVALDISGRPYLEYEVKFKSKSPGFDYSLVKEFFYALAINSKMTLHIKMLKGSNNHHMAESIFKGFAKAFAQAVSIDKKSTGIPSTKGKL